MTFATPLGLLALLAIPAIVAIHLFRRRFPPRPVAGLFLWQPLQQMPPAGRRIHRLPVTASLLLECLAALAFALILAGARVRTADVTEHLVVLLDDSASMSAASRTGERARDRAARRVLNELDRMGAGARVTIVLSGERPTVLAGPAAFALEARSALNAWRPDAPHHSLALGLRLAREVAGSTGRLLIVSDALPEARGEELPVRALWAAVGERLPNVGITAAERTLSPDEGRGAVSLALHNSSDASVRTRVAVIAGQTEVASRELELSSGTSTFTLPIPAGLPPVRVTLPDDALARDNGVVLAEPRPRIVGVENHLPEGRGRDALARALDALSGVTRAEAGHLAFVDAAALGGERRAGAWRAGFGTPPDGWRASGGGEDVIGPFVLEKRHPLLLGVTLGGIVWTGAVPIRGGAVHPLVSAGDRVLVGRANVPAPEADILFNLDLGRTNLIRSPDWPILVSNLVEMRRAALPGPERWNYRIGEAIRVRLEREPRGPIRIRCGGVERTLPGGRLLEFFAPSPGGLLQIGDGDEVLLEIGVNFLDETETRLRALSAGEIGELAEAAGLRAESGPASDPLFWLLLITGVAAIVANWLVLQPGGSRA